jgi:ATP-dependent DNA ligase
VIAGITQPRGGRIGFGALLVGFYDQGDLKYAGKVGTGFSDEFLKEWNLKFQKIRRETSPFSDFTDDRNGEHIWLEPVYVGQFEFTEWTDNNKLRHPSFLGLRRDKDPIEIIKEV